MKPHTASTTLWGIGLGIEERQRIRTHSGPEFTLRTWSDKRTPGVKELTEDNPMLLWIPLQAWNGLSSAKRSLYLRQEAMQRVLLVEHGTRFEDLEQALGMGFMEIAKLPLEKKDIHKILDRAWEMKSISSDIFRMTQEIYLERELLARKNEHLSFINRFVSRAAETLDAAEVLVKAGEDLNLLLPVKLLQGAVWTRDARGVVEAEFYLGQPADNGSRDAWVEFLTESVAKLAEAPVGSYRITLLDNAMPRDAATDYAPQQGRVAILPLRSGNETFGCLALLSDSEFRLGRDQVELLHSAARHLALALRNAQLFSEARNQAQFDGLTKLYNRKHFDSRLEEELLRHQRYLHQLSTIMIDLDHFKDINDTHGHLAGDLVLKEVGKLLVEAVRTTDLAARYGGEEFALILPQTDAAQAWALAERIRLRISKKRFTVEGKTFQVTASMGIASLKPGSLKPKSELLREADRALYQAKTSGRNMVIISRPEEQEPALMRA